MPLACVSAGHCGLMIAATDAIESRPDGSRQCPLQSCVHHVQCSKCLQSPRCGWCALGGLNGHGVCMEGGYTGPIGSVGLCTDSTVTSFTNDTVSGKR